LDQQFTAWNGDRTDAIEFPRAIPMPSDNPLETAFRGEYQQPIGGLIGDVNGTNVVNGECVGDAAEKCSVAFLEGDRVNQVQYGTPGLIQYRVSTYVTRGIWRACRRRDNDRETKGPTAPPRGRRQPVGG
jgi:hypothetical protein